MQNCCLNILYHFQNLKIYLNKLIMTICSLLMELVKHKLVQLRVFSNKDNKKVINELENVLLIKDAFKIQMMVC